MYLDGKQFRDFNPDGIAGDELDGALKPGSAHLLAVEIEGATSLCAAAAAVAGCRICLRRASHAGLGAGLWAKPTTDALRYTQPVQLPGKCIAQLARRTVKVDAEHAKQNAVLFVRAEGQARRRRDRSTAARSCGGSIT